MSSEKVSYEDVLLETLILDRMSSRETRQLVLDRMARGELRNLESVLRFISVKEEKSSGMGNFVNNFQKAYLNNYR